MADPGFMIPLNLNDFLFPFDNNSRDICTSANEQTYTKAPWWTCENIQLTAGGTPVSSAVVGTTYVIRIGVEGLPSQGGGTTPAAIQNVQAWVCYPNTVAGGASATLVVPSMQNSQFASFSDTTNTAPLVFWDSNATDYQNPLEGGFQWIQLSPWTPTEEDFLEQSEFGGHCCIIANAAGQSSLEDPDDPTSGEPVGIVITDNSQLAADFDICHSLYQAQRNIVIVPVSKGMRTGRGSDRIEGGLAFLSGAPEQKSPVRTTIAVTAVDQGGQVDPALLKALSGGLYAGLSLKPATSPPKSLRLTVHDHKPLGWLAKIIHEAEGIVEELLGLETHPFGGGHQMHLTLPARGLQPLRVAIEPDPSEAPGTVHAIDITQTDANGARGGIRMALVVIP
jgi:hypothetical protein